MECSNLFVIVSNHHPIIHPVQQLTLCLDENRQNSNAFILSPKTLLSDSLVRFKYYSSLHIFLLNLIIKKLQEKYLC